MILETDNYFVVNDKPQIFSNQTGMQMKIPNEFEGMVFRAALVDGDYVAAEVIERDRQPDEKPIVFSINHTRYDIITVSKFYAEIISNSRKLNYPSEEEMIKLFGGMQEPEGNDPDGPESEYGDGPEFGDFN